MKRPLYLLLPALFFLFSEYGISQQNTGTITGRIRDTSMAGTNIEIFLQEFSTRTVIQGTNPDSTGNYIFYNVPFGTYNIRIMLDSNLLALRHIAVISNVPVRVDIDSPRGNEQGSSGGYSVSHLHAGSHTVYTAQKINELPAPANARRIEAVLLNTPGVVPDANGRMHVRGQDARMQYVIDGIPVTENMSRLYASLLNANIIKTVDIQTGGLNAEYGMASSGVMAVTTKSGYDRFLSAQASLAMGSYGLNERTAEFAGNLGRRIAFFGSYGDFTSKRYLDPTGSFEPNHSSGTSSYYFGKLDGIISDDMTVTALGMYSLTRSEIPNSLTDSKQNQVQNQREFLIGARLNYLLNENSLISLLGFSRSANSSLNSNGIVRVDTSNYPKLLAENERYFMAADRINDRQGAQLEFSSRQTLAGTQHEFKVGASWERMPITEFFTFAVTDTNISNDDPRLLPHDIRRGGSPFLAEEMLTGNRSSAYIQDQFRLGGLFVGIGVRYDNFRLFETEQEFSPRLNLAYGFTNNFAVRASYNRIFMQAPVENILVSGSDEARTLSGAGQGSVPARVRAEKAHAFELGANYSLNEFWNFDLVGYSRLIDDFLVGVDLGSAGMSFPANLRNGFVAGGEFKARLNNWNNFSAQLTLSTISSLGLVPQDGSPVAAGLILGGEARGYNNPVAGQDAFPTEHDQLLSASANISYSHPSSLFLSLTGRFDSGLPFDLRDSTGRGLDAGQARAELVRRGYSEDVISLLSLESGEAGSHKRVAPRAIFDLSAGYSLTELVGIPIRVTGTVINVFNTRYLYKFDPGFGSAHYGIPQSFVLRGELLY